MSFIKLFAPPEWDADVPEESHLENLTKKAKLRRLKKNGQESVDLNGVTKEDVIAESKPKKRKETRDDEATTPNIGTYEDIAVKKKKNKNKIENMNETISLDKEADQVSKKKKKAKKHILDDGLLLKKLMSEKIDKSDNVDTAKPIKKRKLHNEEKQNSTLDTRQKQLDNVSETTGELKKKKKIKLNHPAPEIQENFHKQPSHKNAKKKMLKLETTEPQLNVVTHTHTNVETNKTPSQLTKTEKNRKRRRKKNKYLPNASLDTSLNPESANINSKHDEKNSKSNIQMTNIPTLAKKPKSNKNKRKTLITALEINNESQILENNVQKNNSALSKQTESETKKSSGAKLHSKKLQALLSEQINSPEPGVQVENGEGNIKTNKTDRKIAREHKTLRQRMMEKLKGARFRYLNEQMYVKESKDAKQLFNEDPTAFDAYHNGYRQQVSKWPLNPLDIIIKDISQLPKEYIIADLGCGDGRLSKSVPQKVHSFDLVSLDPSIQACDMSHTPLLSSQVNVVVFCLSLMGTNLMDYIMEANRVLKNGGLLKIAEVESRFENVDAFLKDVQKYGFSLIKSDLNQNLFYFMDFKKESEIKKRNKLPQLTLNPCLYKKR